MKPEHAKYKDTDTLFEAFDNGELLPTTRCAECIMHDTVPVRTCGMVGTFLGDTITGCLGGAKLPTKDEKK